MCFSFSEVPLFWFFFFSSGCKEKPKEHDFFGGRLKKLVQIRFRALAADWGDFMGQSRGVVTWGDVCSGGDSREVQCQLQNVRQASEARVLRSVSLKLDDARFSFVPNSRRGAMFPKAHQTWKRCVHSAVQTYCSLAVSVNLVASEGTVNRPLGFLPKNACQVNRCRPSAGRRGWHIKSLIKTRSMLVGYSAAHTSAHG